MSTPGDSGGEGGGPGCRIEHVAVWTRDLERLKAFYERYFAARAGGKYINPRRCFESYFLSFGSGARLELMQTPVVAEPPRDPRDQVVGYVHLAISVGSEQRVDEITARLRTDDYRVLEEPRRTGDGYYESVVLDPDGNRVEITI